MPATQRTHINLKDGTITSTWCQDGPSGQLLPAVPRNEAMP